MYQTNNYIKLAALSNDNYQYRDQIKQEELEDLFSALDIPLNEDAEWLNYID